MTRFDRHTITEWRARRIANPIDRLKFLRLHMAAGQSPAAQGGWIFSTSLALITVVFVLAFTPSHSELGPIARPMMLPPSTSIQSDSDPPSVWLVDSKNGVETYSNGLRIENRYAIANKPRGRYAAYARAHPDVGHATWLDKPAGIVYHTTESLQAPLEADHNKALQTIGNAVRNIVQQNRSYHFLIDRFGRAFRVVREEDVAFHAGHSVWADAQHVFVGLNTSFLGIAFETESQPGRDFTSANPAQVHAGRVLTAMLRNKYGILAANCVTHAMVSVNPWNGLIGYHTDWAANFPFSELGLRDNYMEPPVSIVLFGFGYDTYYVQATGARLLPGLIRAEDQVRLEAIRRGVPVREYKELLQKNFAQIAAQEKVDYETKENANAQ